MASWLLSVSWCSFRFLPKLGSLYFRLRPGRVVQVTWSTLCPRLRILDLGLHGPREQLNLFLGLVGHLFRSLDLCIIPEPSLSIFFFFFFLIGQNCPVAWTVMYGPFLLFFLFFFFCEIEKVTREVPWTYMCSLINNYKVNTPDG